MMNDKAPKTLVDQKHALSLFLESLLREPEEAPAPPETPVVETKAPQPVIKPVEEPAPIPQPTLPVETQQPTVITTEVEDETAVTPTEPEKTTPEETDWTREFQAMLFKVAGLTLAVPLEELSGVVEWKGDLTEMPGHADFYLGVLQHLGKSVPVVDTARLVFPQEKLQALAGDDPEARITRIVLIDEGRWGLAVDSVEQVITLRREEVQWRSERTQRKWLLGTIKQHMCALLDTQAFAEKLITGDD